MQIHIALQDPAPTSDAARTWIVGAFSSDEKAQAACEAVSGEDDLTDDRVHTPLAWTDFSAKGNDGAQFAILLVELDVPQS